MASDSPVSHDASSLVVGDDARLHMDVRMASLNLGGDHGSKKQISGEKCQPDPTAPFRLRARKNLKESESTQGVIASGPDGSASGISGIDVVSGSPFAVLAMDTLGSFGSVRSITNSSG